MDDVEVYELFVTITKTTRGAYEWGVGQELELENGDEEFEFLAGGEEDTLEEASLEVSKVIKTLF